MINGVFASKLTEIQILQFTQRKIFRATQLKLNNQTKFKNIRCSYFYEGVPKDFAFLSDSRVHVDIKISFHEITDAGKYGQELPENSHLWQSSYEIFISLTLSQIIVPAEKVLELGTPCSEQTKYSFTKCQYST